jgi:hypothetical protein
MQLLLLGVKVYHCINEASNQRVVTDGRIGSMIGESYGGTEQEFLKHNMTVEVIT